MKKGGQRKRHNSTGYSSIQATKGHKTKEFSYQIYHFEGNRNKKEKRKTKTD